MREPLKDKNRLEHIVSAIDTILNRAESISFDNLISDKILFGGIVYHTMIIGEAAYKLSKKFIASHRDTPWQNITDMRHHLVHGYYKVDSTIIWNVIKNDLRPLREQVQRYINETDWDAWEQQENSI